MTNHKDILRKMLYLEVKHGAEDLSSYARVFSQRSDDNKATRSMDVLVAMVRTSTRIATIKDIYRKLYPDSPEQEILTPEVSRFMDVVDGYLSFIRNAFVALDDPVDRRTSNK